MLEEPDEKFDGYSAPVLRMIEEDCATYGLGNERRGVRNFKDLHAWRCAMDLVVLVYRLTSHWPSEETYGLTKQIRRTAVSVPSNIAGGQGRKTDAEFANRLRIAHGSLREVETQLLIAQRLEMGKTTEIDTALTLSHRTGQLCQGLLRSLST
jgi:four helix bundle protein